MPRRFGDAAIEALRGVARAPREASGATVESVVVRVADQAGPALVTIERIGSGVRTACSCGVPACRHLAAATDAFAAQEASGLASGLPGAVRATEPPPAAGQAAAAPVEAGAGPSRPGDAELAERLGALLDALVREGIAAGSERAEQEMEALVRGLHGTDTYGLHRSLADLRRELSTSRPAPDRVLRAVEVLAATRELLEASASGGRGAVDRGAWGLLVGCDVPLAETEIREDMTLLEVARNSARTPFGYRREERFLIDSASGVRYHELVPDPLDGKTLGGPDRYRGSVGPFPRLVRGEMVAVEPGPQPRRIRLLQYRVDLPVGTEDLRRLTETAASDVAALYAEFGRLADVVGCPYPCLAIFAPERVIFRDGETTLADGEGRILPLARAAAPDTCAAADRFLARGRLEVVVGHLLYHRRTLTLSPLSLLMELPQGERLIRLR